MKPLLFKNIACAISAAEGLEKETIRKHLEGLYLLNGKKYKLFLVFNTKNEYIGTFGYRCI